MIISDRQTAIVPIAPADQGREVPWTDKREIVAILSMLFDLAWADAIPLASSIAQDPDDDTQELLETQRQLLKLLAAGATDETVARHMGISLRTARRHMAGLMKQLAATSRFQAGAEAAKRGWLS